MNEMNRIHNATNPYQGGSKRVLCVCSAGLLRSPTAALVLSQPPFNFNTRAAGLEESYALIPVDEVLVYWAEEIVCMTEQHRILLVTLFPDANSKIVVLAIPDNFRYRSPDLMKLIADQYSALKENTSGESNG